MDKDVRNAIERATQKARRILEEDFAEQLDATYDVRADGRVAEKGGAHLTGRQHLLRDKIVAAIEHKRSAAMKPTEAVADYIRDAAFTALNRFVALKMLEARELVQECISRGDGSSGFAEFCGLAPAIKIFNGAGYRLYIESIFDELSTEVKVLFDRRDAASVLWPKKAAFGELLEILNADELKGVWSEDETIGWFYQFFNSGEERRKMREESQAPRNSRELAIRNQFFTPRYVVQFLCDNTLGRIWYEMSKGDTRLTNICEYLLQPIEGNVVVEGERGLEGSVSSDVNRDEVRLPPGAKKDPRDIRILDPACGSGHFLLYCFILLLSIYEEAWSDETVPESGATGRTLRDDYSTLQELRKAAPVLILQHNLHGVDIDPRCAQIAQLALWMRAQRAWKDLGIPAIDRPRIQGTHIVVAETMPGDAALVNEFAARLDPPLLRDLFKKMIDESRRAGDLGALLRIEDAVAAEIRHAREQFVKQRELTEFLPGMELVDKQSSLDFSGIDDDSFFHEAENRIVEALRTFAETATGSVSVRWRLFAGDAAQGIALIDLVRTRFDVVLMNPPFGLVPESSKDVFRFLYPDDWTEIYACFLVRGLELLAPKGRLGAITSNLWLITQRQLALRSRLISQCHLVAVADLGSGVLDGAAVETAVTIIENRTTDAPTSFADLTAFTEKAIALKDADWQRVLAKHFNRIPNTPFCFFLGEDRLRLWDAPTRLEPDLATVAKGNTTFDNFRFLRLHFEISPAGSQSNWIWYDKGGEFQPFMSPTPLVWRFSEEARENRAYQIGEYGTDAQVCQSSKWWTKAGLCYPHVTSVGFSPRVLPAGQVAGSEALGIYTKGDSVTLALLGFLASTYTQDLIYAFGRHRKVENRAVAGLPIGLEQLSRHGFDLAELAKRGVLAASQLEATVETSPLFCRPPITDEISSLLAELARVLENIDQLVAETLWSQALVPQPVSVRRSELVRIHLGRRFGNDHGDLLQRRWMSFAFGVCIGRFAPVTSAVQLLVKTSPFDPIAFESPATISTGKVKACAETEPNRTGILVTDDGHRLDAANQVAREMGYLADYVSGQVADDKKQMQRFFAHEFFDWHLSEYSLLGRSAPIYWQLATPSASYSVWLYIHACTKDTLFRVQNDYVVPKLAYEQRQLESIRVDFGPNPNSTQRNAIAMQEGFVAELQTFIDDVKWIAPLWNPNLDDGVIINFAPLWRLVPQHRRWQKELKNTWNDLCAGTYDWAHLAMHLWPERVVPKCAKDRSLAIAHGLEDIFWFEDKDGKWKPHQKPQKPIAELISERTSAAVKAALKSLLDAPEPALGAKRSRKPKAA